MPFLLSRDEARRRMVAYLGLARQTGRGARGVRALLERLRCIQLDPLDAIGTNADLVVMARVGDVVRGDVWRYLFPRYAFEHFAKERCILPRDAFPRYRGQGHAAQARWWRHAEREARIPAKLAAAVLAEIRERGPVTARDLTDHGSVDPIDWSGWTGTARATSMAIELLWTRCDIVVAGRTESGAKLYDVPERSLRWDGSAGPPAAFARWALAERVRAAGLLTRAGGSMWSMLEPVRTSPLADRMVEEGELVDVEIEGTSRRYLAHPGFLSARGTPDDDVRILGPLDPLLWDRGLVRHLFGFDYVWEVYKPESQRRWGWYVCPLLHRGRLAGRVDARIEGKRMIVRRLWLEGGGGSECLDAVRVALDRHAGKCGATRVQMPRRVSME